MAATPAPKGQHKPFAQTELFAANMLEWPVKDDLASMEFPLFSLSKRPDTKVREYISPSTHKRVKVIPSVLGAAPSSTRISCYISARRSSRLDKLACPSPVLSRSTPMRS